MRGRRWLKELFNQHNFLLRESPNNRTIKTFCLPVMNFDLFTNARSSAELAYDSVLIMAEFIKNLDRGLYDNDASHPGNSLFIRHGDSKLLKGVDPSSIIGTLLVDQNSQTFVACTADEILPEVPSDDEMGTWDIPYARNNSSDHIERAVRSL